MSVILLRRYEARDLLVAGKATEQNCPINEKSNAGVATTMYLSSHHLGDGDEELKATLGYLRLFQEEKKKTHH